MPADPEMWEAFFDHLRKMIAKLQDELAPYLDGSQQVAKRPYGGEWVDITQQHIDEIKREIASLENTLARYGRRA